MGNILCLTNRPQFSSNLCLLAPGHNQSDRDKKGLTAAASLSNCLGTSVMTPTPIWAADCKETYLSIRPWRFLDSAPRRKRWPSGLGSLPERCPRCTNRPFFASTKISCPFAKTSVSGIEAKLVEDFRCSGSIGFATLDHNKMIPTHLYDTWVKQVACNKK
jgi:hypothetical protein